VEQNALGIRFIFVSNSGESWVWYWEGGSEEISSDEVDWNIELKYLTLSRILLT
jgi:hypothetical protein